MRVPLMVGNWKMHKTASEAVEMVRALLERDMITDALKSTRGNMAAAARQLGVTARIIRYKAKNLGIDCRQFNGRSG